MAKGNSVKIRIDGDASDLEKKLKNIGNVAKSGLADVKAGIDMATAAMKTFANVAEKGIAYNATIEQLKTSFEVMTGSAEKATETVERLRVMGAETPFEMKDLASTTQLLMQYGFSADEALDRMKMLGDVAQGNVQAMTSIAMGYAQMSSAGKVNLQDIKQMINGGFNPLQEISERTGESMASLYDRISKGKMTVDEITESMRHATSEGGRFYQSMEKQSQTLNGQLSTLKDNAEQLLGSLTEGVSEGLRDQMLPFANNLVAELQSAFDTGGYQGLVDKATNMIPELLDVMTAKLEKGTPGLVQKLSQNSTKLLQAALPGSLRMAGAITPQIAQGLFEIAGSLIGELVGMLPELTPILIKGFGDLFVASYKGIEKGLASVWQGVENAIHNGKTQIAGAWVDDELIAKFDFKIDTNLADAKGTIDSAYSEIRTALQTDLLTPDQIAEIEGMIGDDYNEIKAKLMSFGLTEEEAAPLAKTVSDAGQTITDAFSAIKVSVDGETLSRWAMEAKGSRLLLRNRLQEAGLTDAEVGEVLAVYDEMLGKVKEGTPNVMQEIYDKLTDGKPDDKQTVDALNEQITSYIEGLIAKAKLAYETKLAELDPAAKDYEEKKKALDEWYATTTASITQMDTGMRSLVSELAGAPTAVVQARLNEIAGYEQQLAALEEDIDRVQGKAKSAAENAFNIVRSGTNTDESTVEQAVNLKITEFALDKQAAEDARAAAIEALNASGKTGEEYEVELGEIEAKFTIDTESAKNRFDEAFGQIISGIAEGENVDAALQQAYESYQATIDVSKLITDIQTTGTVDPAQLESVSASLASVLGEAFNPERLAEYAEGTPDRLINYLADMMGLADDTMYDAAQTALGGKIGAVYQGLLEGGFLEGSGFDTSTVEGQLTAIFSAVNFGNVAASVQGEATAAAVQIGTAATTEEKDIMDEGGESAGDWMDIGAARGIRNGASKVINAAKAVARATISAFKNILGIASPSKVFMEMGEFTGEGYAIGLQNSMANAVAVAKRMTGQVVTAAELSQTMRVNIPTLTQDIILANEQSERSVNLYVNGKELGRVMAADNQLAQNRYNRTIAMGVGKK